MDEIQTTEPAQDLNEALDFTVALGKAAVNVAKGGASNILSNLGNAIKDVGGKAFAAIDKAELVVPQFLEMIKTPEAIEATVQHVVKEAGVTDERTVRMIGNSLKASTALFHFSAPAQALVKDVKDIFTEYKAKRDAATPADEVAAEPA